MPSLADLVADPGYDAGLEQARRLAGAADPRPTLSSLLMNQTMLQQPHGPEYGVRQRLDPPQSIMTEMAQPDRSLTFAQRAFPEPSFGGGMELAANIIGGPSLRGIRAYHGSPHKFDKFSMDRIGTGEGAQAYGHGLYFAENEAVAKNYREALAGTPQVKFAGKDYAFAEANKALTDWQKSNPVGSYMDRIRRDVQLHTTRSLVMDNAGELTPGLIKELVSSYPKEVRPQIRQWIDEAANVVRPHLSIDRPGHMYEVNIRANPEQFLDWDRPLSGQTPHVQKAVSEASRQPTDFLAYPGQWMYEKSGLRAAMDRPNPPTGEGLYSWLSNRSPGSATQSDLAASQALREAGIPGIKYLDQGSRTAGQGSSNYVVFDDSIIDILKRYGLAGLPAAGAVSQQLGEQ